MTINERQQQRLANIVDSPALRLGRRINDLLRQQQRLANIVDSPALRLGRRINDLLRQQQRLANMMEPPALRLSRKVQERNTQSLKSVGAELAARTTAAVAIVEATRRSIEITDPLSGFQQQFQRTMAEPLRQVEQLQKTLSVDIVASVSSLHRQHKRIIQDHFRGVELLRQSVSSNFLPLHNALTDSAAAMVGLAEATRRSIEIADPLSGFQQQFQRAMVDSLRQTEQIQKALRLSFLPVTTLSSQLHDILQAKTSLAALDPTFAGEMQAWLHDGEATTSEPEREEFLAYLFGWLIEKFQQLLQCRISPEVFNTLLTVSFFLYSTWSDRQMENRLMEKLTVPASEKQIVRKMGEIRPSLPYRKRYVVAVTDRLRLRSEPSLKAPVLAFLLPNTLVEEIEQHESWSLVEFSDYTDGSVKKGWVYRDYLRAIQPEKG